MRRFLLFLGLFLLCLSVGPAAAQPALMRFDRLAGDEIGGIVWDVETTPDGALWAATQIGLYRMDGVRVRRWTGSADDSTGLGTSNLLSLFTASDGRLWIGTNGQGVVVMDPSNGSISRVQGPAAAVGFCELTSGQLLAATPNEGVWRVSETGGVRLTADEQVTDVLCFDGEVTLAGRQGVWRARLVGDSLDVSLRSEFMVVTSILRDPDGGYVVSVNDADASAAAPGLVWLSEDLAEVRTSRLEVGTPWAYDLARDRAGRVWLATDEGLYFDEGGELHRVERSGIQRDDLGTDDVRSLLADGQGQLFIGSGVGVYRADVNQRTLRPRLLKVEGVEAADEARPPVTALLESSDESVWVGTYSRGLLRYGPSGAAHYRDPEGVTAHYRDPEGVTAHYRDPEGVTAHYRDPEGVTALAEDASGALWVGSISNGLFLLDPRTGKRESYTPMCPRTGCGGRRTVLDVVPGADAIWLTTNGAGLMSLDPASGSFTEYLPAERNAGYMTGMVADSAGLWVGSYRGLYRFDFGSRRFSRVDSTFDHHILSLFQSRDGMLWASTNGFGLAMRDPDSGTWRRYSKNDGLPSNLVVDADEDAAGRIWVLTQDLGAAVMAHRDEGFRRVDASLGAPGDGSPGGLTRALDGGVLMASSGVLARVSSETLPPPRPPGITVETPDRQLARGMVESLEQPGDYPIRVSVVSFEGPGASCAYRWEGEERWQECGGPEVQIAGFGKWPGRRTLQVRAETARGGSLEAAYTLDLLPAWWQTWPAGLAGLGLMGFLVWGSVTVLDRRRQAIALKEEARLQRGRQAERDQIASWLHDHAINDLIASRFDLEAIASGADPQAVEAAEVLSSRLLGVRDQLRAVVSELRIPDLELGLGSAVEKLLDAVQKANPGLEVRFKGPAAPDYLTLRQRQNLFIACRTCVNNVVRHARATRLSVAVSPGRVEIVDDGVGFDVARRLGEIEGGDHFGILLARSHMDTIGGRFEVRSAPGAGTRVVLTCESSERGRA